MILVEKNREDQVVYLHKLFTKLKKTVTETGWFTQIDDWKWSQK